VVGQPLPKAVIVVVRDAFGNPVPDASLTVRPAQGTVTDSALATDSSGRAALRWSLGRTGGVHRLEVRAAGVDSVLVVTARARAGSAANVAFRTPPARATAGTPARIAAAVTDGYGNPVPDVLVVFAAGAGRLSVSRVMTDTSGIAATRWTPGVGGGDQSLTATVRGTAIKATHAVRVTAPTR
jgi:adhesin/invasin